MVGEPEVEHKGQHSLHSGSHQDRSWRQQECYHEQSPVSEYIPNASIQLRFGTTTEQYYCSDVNFMACYALIFQ